MAPKITLPLILLPNMQLVLKGVYVYAKPPQMKPTVPGPYRALIDTGTGNSWVKPSLGSLMAPYPLDELLVDEGKGKQENMTVDVKFGFQKGLSAKPVEGWVQLHSSLCAYRHLLLAGDFDAEADVILGTDALSSFARCGIVFHGIKEQFLVIEDKD
jgi:hypothetical protein